MGGQRQETSNGHTLLELLMVLAIMGLLATQTVWGLTDWRDRYRLLDTADRYRQHLQLSRQMALAHQMPVRLQFARSATTSCYRLVLGPSPACSCIDPACPTGKATIAQVNLAPNGKLSVAPVGTTSEFLIDPGLGTFQPTVRTAFNLESGYSVHQITNLTGRTRSCSPQGTWHGLPAC